MIRQSPREILAQQKLSQMDYRTIELQPEPVYRGDFDNDHGWRIGRRVIHQWTPMLTARVKDLLYCRKSHPRGESLACYTCRKEPFSLGIVFADEESAKRLDMKYMMGEYGDWRDTWWFETWESAQVWLRESD